MKRLFFVGVAAASLTMAACSSSSPSSTTNTTSSPTSTGGSGTTAALSGNPPSAVTLNEAGSSLLYPYLSELVGPLHAQYPNITLSPAPGGSGKGISDAIAGLVQMGGSDAYLSASQISQNPGLLNVPIAISSQAVDYNLAGVANHKLTGNVLAEIYMGKITKWNDPAIASLNPGVTLPSTTIVPVRRVDGSGDTFIFTSFLSATNSAWSSGPSMGTTVTWPAVTGEVTANGNPGMVQTCHATPGCVAYVGISAESSAKGAGLEEAMLQNQAGAFLQSTPATVASAVSAGGASVPTNLAASLIYQPGAQSYPIVNFEYLVVKSTQQSADVAQAIRTFLTWAISPTGGATAANLKKDQFLALPASVVPKVEAAVATITG